MDSIDLGILEVLCIIGLANIDSCLLLFLQNLFMFIFTFA